jgi:hypothetical protein
MEAKGADYWVLSFLSFSHDKQGEETGVLEP